MATAGPPCPHGHEPLRAADAGGRAAHPRPRGGATARPRGAGARGPSSPARATGRSPHRAGRAASRRAPLRRRPTVVIRPAAPSDNAAIAAIWNREVLQTAATSDTEPRDPEAQRVWLDVVTLQRILSA